MTLDTLRAFPFRVRPRHLETEESLTRRVLDANGEPEALVRRLLNDAGHRGSDWASILHTKNRSSPRTVNVPMLHHRDGTSCPQCTDLLPKRTMCSHCARGEVVEQVPHFGAPVCLRHSRWTGLLDTDAEHHRVGEEHRAAAVAFGKLVRKRLLDVRLYKLVSTAVMSEHQLSESGAFPATIAIVRAVTSLGFQRELFNRALSFDDTLALLADTVARAAGMLCPETSRMLWLVLRPAFATAHAEPQHRAEHAHPHDVPVHAQAYNRALAAPRQQVFSSYLAVTSDTVATATTLLAPTHARLDPDTRRFHLVCPHGHAYLSANPSARCSVCPHGAEAVPAVNDLATIAPRLLDEWDWTANAPLTPHMVTARSSKKVVWRCPKDHQYTATANNRTSNDQGCPVCLNRVIVAGVNDFAARYPTQFAELSPRARATYNPHRHTPTSPKLVDWECSAGHVFKARFKERAAGLNCPQCRRLRSVAQRGSLADTHPEIAGEWVTTDDGRTPRDYSAGSKYPATWRCDKGHEYPARIERRVAGTGCPYCANRLLMPGFNDLATTHPALAAEWHPYRNRERAEEVFAGATPRRWWKCRYGHETHQSAPHRITSRGCTTCAPGERALRATLDMQAAHAPLAEEIPKRLEGGTGLHTGFGDLHLDGSDEAAMVEALNDLFAPRGFSHDSIIDAWAEVAGFTSEHHAPAPILRAILAQTPAVAAFMIPSAHGLADAVINLYTVIHDSLLPAPLQLVTATRAALRVIHDCDGPFDNEDDYLDALLRRTADATELTQV